MISRISWGKVRSGLVTKAVLYLSCSSLSRTTLRAIVFPSPTSPMRSARHSFPSSMANSSSAIAFSKLACILKYIPGSGTLSKGASLSPQYC